MNKKRITLLITLISFLLILMTYYSVAQHEHDPPFTTILANPVIYQNNTLTIKGTITTIYPDNNTIILTMQQPPFQQITITNITITNKMQLGDTLEIYGTLSTTHTLHANKIIHYPSWKYTLIYLRSIPAIPFTLYFLFHTWKFNLKKLQFQRRNS